MLCWFFIQISRHCSWVMLWQRLLEMQEIQKFQLYLEDPSSSHCCHHLCWTQRNGFSAIWLFCSGS